MSATPWSRFPFFTNGRPSRQLVLEFNPHQVLAAEISQGQRDKVVLEATAEFAREDLAGLNHWLQFRPRLRTVCGLVPHRGIVQRESLDLRRLPEADYLANVVEEQQKRQFLSATPFKVVNPEAWTLRAVDATEGKRLAGASPAQPAVICGIANDEIHSVQRSLLNQHVLPDRIEAGLLSLVGVMSRLLEKRGNMQAVAIVVLQEIGAAVYILGKEGVHTPAPLFHGLGSMADLVKKELGLKDDAEVLRLIDAGDPRVVQRADRLIRPIARDLKPVLDSYEMTTGQPLDEIFCAYLPASMTWLSEALAKATSRVSMAVDCSEWLLSAGVQRADTSTALGAHWLGLLGLIDHRPHSIRLKPERDNDTAIYHRPWHVDYQLDVFSTERQAASRRFLATVVAGAALAFAVVLTAWQLYAINSRQEDLSYWEKQIATNRQLFDELTASNLRLQAQSGALKQAYDLMAPPYQLSDFLLALGRTIPPRMRVDRIEANDAHTAISGILFEPADEATGTLGGYIGALRRNPTIGALFSSITITSLQRRADSDTVVCEITLRPKEPTP